MSPELKSTLGTIIAFLIGGAVVWTVKVGIVPASQEQTVLNTTVTVILGLIGYAVDRYKRSQVSPPALVAAVQKIKPEVVAAAVAKADPKAVIALVNNQPNGLKVVASSGPGIVERAPLK